MRGVGSALGASQVGDAALVWVTWPALPPEGWGGLPSGSQKFRVWRAEGREQTPRAQGRLWDGRSRVLIEQCP